VVAEQEVLLIDNDEGRIVRLILDDEKHAGLAGNVLELMRRTKWSGERLVTQVSLQSGLGLELLQTLEVDHEGHQ
jgi:hypothetical protein